MIKRYVLTGGAGSGKTTILNELKKLGYPVVDEVARSLIIKLKEENPSLLPWNDRDGFQILIEKMQYDNYNNNVGFFDRSIIDEVAYRNFNGVELPIDFMEQCNHCKHDKIFIFPPFEEIYKTDSERVETFEEAAAIYQYIYDGYKMLGYEPIIVEKDTIENRVKFIINNI